MANFERRDPRNAAGAWFVDDRCIDCDTCRQLAPAVFGETGDQSVVVHQPEGPEEVEAAARALVACPVAAIGVRGEKPPASGLFPQRIDGDVHYCGYNAEASYGANAFFVRRAAGNLLVDSPRWVPALVRSLEAAGGLSAVLLTHRDDVADAERYAAHFGARVYIHEDDASAAPFATDLLRGPAPVEVSPDLVAVPVPGHTRGSVVYVWREHYAFTGDSLYWSRKRNDLGAFRDACWYSWSAQADSLERLADHRFEWVLAGHGDRGAAPAEEMRTRLLALVTRMRARR